MARQKAERPCRLAGCVTPSKKVEVSISSKAVEIGAEAESVSLAAPSSVKVAHQAQGRAALKAPRPIFLERCVLLEVGESKDKVTKSTSG